MSDDKRKTDTKFWVGLAILIFLVLMNSFVAEVPLGLVVVPAIMMGVNIKDVVEFIKAWRK